VGKPVAKKERKKERKSALNPKCGWQRMILECIFREAESVDGKWKKLA
jgi:hypothetical protein